MFLPWNCFAQTRVDTLRLAGIEWKTACCENNKTCSTQHICTAGQLNACRVGFHHHPRATRDPRDPRDPYKPVVEPPISSLETSLKHRWHSTFFIAEAEAMLKSCWICVLRGIPAVEAELHHFTMSPGWISPPYAAPECQSLDKNEIFIDTKGNGNVSFWPYFSFTCQKRGRKVIVSGKSRFYLLPILDTLRTKKERWSVRKKIHRVFCSHPVMLRRISFSYRISDWWFHPLWKCESLGILIPHAKMKHVPNHQPNKNNHPWHIHITLMPRIP